MANIIDLKDIKQTLQLKKKNLLPFLSAIIIALAYISYQAAGMKILGLTLFAVALIPTLKLEPAVWKYTLTFLLATLLLALAPLTTVFSWHRFIIMASLMIGAVVLPYIVSQYFGLQHLIHFNFDWSRRWKLWEIAYIVSTAIVVYLLMPYYFKSTGDIHAWYFQRHIGEISIVFGSIMVIGIWEEFFFTASVLSILRRYLPFTYANCIQAIMFSGFLYAIGFRFWAPFGMFCYAFAQGWVFTKTRSLLLVLVVHVCVDLLVCFVLLNAYYPDLARIFITN